MRENLVTEYNELETSVVYKNNYIADTVKIGHFVLIRENNWIDDNVRIGSYTEIAHHVTIAKDVQIHSKCFIPEGTLIGEGAWIGPCVTFVNDPYPQTEGKHRKGATVKRKARIGASATIMAGVTIGENVLIGAGSVVTKNVPPGETWVGNPARKLNED